MQLSRYIVSFFIFIISLNAKSIPISQIDINGIDLISRGTVLSYIPIEVGDEFNSELEALTINSLLKTNFFESVSTKFSNGLLEIQIKENPTIKFIDFKNFAKDSVLSEDVIESLKKTFNLSQGKIYSDSNLQLLINKLQDLYKEKAYYKTKISIKKSIDEQNRIGISLDFDEGNKALITKMNIEGNAYLKESELLDLFEIGEPDFFIVNYFTKKDHFSQKAFLAGIENIKNLYLEKGFLDIQVTETKIDYLDEKDSLTILINLEEGNQYKLFDINFEGDLLGEKNTNLRDLIEVKNGDIFERQKIIAGVKKINTLYKNKGYAYSEVNTSTTLVDSNKVKINIAINPDKKIYIDRINIEGNHTTQDDVIRRKLLILEGQSYSKNEIDESIKNIKRLGYFNDVSYEINRQTVNNDKVDLLIKVEETKTGEISVGLSHSNSTGAALTAGISQKNILGTGNTLKAAFSNSDAVKESSIYFLDPFFNNFGHSISYGFFTKTTNAENLETSSYNLDESGVLFGYGVPTSLNSKIFGEFKFSSVDLTCGSSIAVDEASQCSKNDDLDMNFTISYSKDTLNDYFFATDGSKSQIKTVFALPISDFKYYKLETSNKTYIPIFKNKTLKFSNRLNLASGYGGEELPFFKRYFEGGSSSVRGFDFNSLGAKYSSTGKPKGGELSFLSSVGLASSLAFLGVDNENMRISAFIDAGTIAEKKSNFKIDDIRSSSGIQFSWLTPIGPIGLSFAQPLIKKASDSTQTFAFELGSSF